MLCGPNYTQIYNYTYVQVKYIVYVYLLCVELVILLSGRAQSLIQLNYLHISG